MKKPTMLKKETNEMFNLLKRLFPICRSITGNGVRETLKIIQEMIPINILEVPSGTRVFDWVVPDEWNIFDAYIKDSKGNKIVDYCDCNLHIVGYSMPFSGNITLGELKKHLFSLPETPDWIPYVTSYYKKMWGFCISHNILNSLKDDIYEVKVDSSFKKGGLTYGELLIKGRSKEEILISTNICHPSMANNELSGPVVVTYLIKELLQKQDLYYTYRFVFIPETIGSITYISQNLNALKSNVKAGYVVVCVGDEGNFSYLPSKQADSLVNRVTEHVFSYSDDSIRIYPFLERGGDERQYCSPGIDLPVGSLMRSKYNEYPEYHTSADNLGFVTPVGLQGSLEKYLECLFVLEKNRTYRNTVLCEPQLGKRNMYPLLSTKESVDIVKDTRNILMYSDGMNDLLSVAEIMGKPMLELLPMVNRLVDNGLLKEI